MGEMGKIAEDLSKAVDFIDKNKDELNKMHIGAFEPLICMLMEEYCKEHGLSMVDEMEKLAAAAAVVNEELGTYGEEEEE